MNLARAIRVIIVVGCFSVVLMAAKCASPADTTNQPSTSSASITCTGTQSVKVDNVLGKLIERYIKGNASTASIVKEYKGVHDTDQVTRGNYITLWTKCTR